MMGLWRVRVWSTIRNGLLPLAAIGVLIAGCDATPAARSTPTATGDSNTDIRVTPRPTDARGFLPTPTPIGEVTSPDRALPLDMRIGDDLRARGVDSPIAGEPFILDGSGNQDDGATRKFSWRQIEGPPAHISDASSPAPAIVPTQPGTYVFEATVSDTTGVKRSRVTVQVADSIWMRDYGPIIMATGGEMAGGSAIALHFALLDSTADLVAVEVQYSMDNGATWQTATEVGAKVARSATGETIEKDILVQQPVPPEQTDPTREPAGETQTFRHTFVWDARADLGTQTTKVIVRGWDPKKKEAIVGTATVYYDPAVDDAASACGIHADLWRLDTETTTTRNRLLDACVIRLVVEHSAAGTLPREQATALESALRKYSAVDGQSASAEQRVADSYAGIETQLENIELQNALQQESRGFQTLSNVLKARHDAAMNSIRNLK